MASKVYVGMHHGPFQQRKKRTEVVSLGYLGSTASDPVLRVQQLEHNILFLQEQHQIMLSGLHREIEVLRRRNRDLQFQLVFSSKNGVTLVQTDIATPSPEEESVNRHVIVSPGQVNIKPLQIELLERDMAELKTNLNEARTRNVYLQGVVTEQKKAIQALENAKDSLQAVGRKIESESSRTQDPLATKDDPEDLQNRFEEADRLTRRLRRENEEQRKEIVSLRNALSKSMSENRRGDGSYRNQRQNQQSQTTRFPPLHQHNQWTNSIRNNGDYQKNLDRGGPRTGKDCEVPSGPSTALPLLRERNNGPASSSGFSAPPFNNHHHNHRRGYPRHHGGSRTYRNNQREPEQD